MSCRSFDHGLCGLVIRASVCSPAGPGGTRTMISKIEFATLQDEEFYGIQEEVFEVEAVFRLPDGGECKLFFVVRIKPNDVLDASCKHPSENMPPKTAGSNLGDDNDSADPVQLDRGDLMISRTDLVIPGRGLSFNHVRSYRGKSGRCTSQGLYWDFGYNLRINVAAAAATKTIPPGYLVAAARPAATPARR